MTARWRVKKSGGKVYGNAGMDQLKRLIGGKKILPDDLVAEEGSDNWVKFSEMPAFAPLFALRSEPSAPQQKHSAGKGQGNGCPQCDAAIAADAVFCVHCGTDMRTGKKVAAADNSSPPGAVSRDDPGGKPRFLGGIVSDTEITVPAALLAVGLAVFAIAGFSKGGTDTAAGMFLFLSLRIVFVVALGIPACFLVARILNTGFGLFHTAVLKLAAIAVLPPAFAMLGGLMLPFTGDWIGWILYFSLLEWLFDIEFYEAILFALVLAGMQILTAVLIARYIVGALGLA